MIEILDWQDLRLAIRGDTVDREQVEWMTDCIFWNEFMAVPVSSQSSILDLGSHIGSFALRAGRRARCRVWALEADQESATLHRINAMINGIEDLQTVYTGAAGERTGQIELHESTANWGHTTTGVSSPFNVLTGRRRCVECLDLEAILDRARVARCAFMKLNVEGAEFGFIRGARLADLTRIDRIVAELHFDLAPAEPLPPLVDKLRSAGFATKVLPDPNTELRGWLVASH